MNDKSLKQIIREELSWLDEKNGLDIVKQRLEESHDIFDKLSLYLSKLVNSSLIPFRSEISAGIDIHSDSYFSVNRCAVASQSFIFLELI